MEGPVQPLSPPRPPSPSWEEAEAEDQPLGLLLEMCQAVQAGGTSQTKPELLAPLVPTISSPRFTRPSQST
ncbi:hypothetical protein PAMP_004189 [Pampus punctatissimus]